MALPRGTAPPAGGEELTCDVGHDGGAAPQDERRVPAEEILAQLRVAAVPEGAGVGQVVYPLLGHPAQLQGERHIGYSMGDVLPYPYMSHAPGTVKHTPVTHLTIDQHHILASYDYLSNYNYSQLILLYVLIFEGISRERCFPPDPGCHNNPPRLSRTLNKFYMSLLHAHGRC